MSNRGTHWKRVAPGLIRQYLFQDATRGEVIIRQVTGRNGSNISVHLPRRCMDCGSTRPGEGFAPVFNANQALGPEQLVLVCNSCYDKRCAREAAQERQEEARRKWLEKDQARRRKNAEYVRTFREKQRKAG